MTYTGTLVTDLEGVVEACFKRHSFRTCANCGQCYGDHRKVGHSCPDRTSAVPVDFETRFLERLT